MTAQSGMVRQNNAYQTSEECVLCVITDSNACASNVHGDDSEPKFFVQLLPADAPTLEGRMQWQTASCITQPMFGKNIAQHARI